MGKGNAHITNDPRSAAKRSNLAAANAAATAKKAGKAGKGEKQKPTEAELTQFAQQLDRDMAENARNNFRRGLIASVIAVAIIVALVFVAKAFLGDIPSV